jgi:hypothetical protein
LIEKNLDETKLKNMNCTPNKSENLNYKHLIKNKMIRFNFLFLFLVAFSSITICLTSCIQNVKLKDDNSIDQVDTLFIKEKEINSENTLVYKLVKGKLEGFAYSYFPNGKIAVKTFFIKGKKNGKCYHYFKNGGLKYEYQYYKDQRILEKKYYPYGKLEYIKVSNYSLGTVHAEKHMDSLGFINIEKSNYLEMSEKKSGYLINLIANFSSKIDSIKVAQNDSFDFNFGYQNNSKKYFTNPFFLSKSDLNFKDSLCKISITTYNAKNKITFIKTFYLQLKLNSLKDMTNLAPIL